MSEDMLVSIGYEEPFAILTGYGEYGRVICGERYVADVVRLLPEDDDIGFCNEVPQNPDVTTFYIARCEIASGMVVDNIIFRQHGGRSYYISCDHNSRLDEYLTRIYGRPVSNGTTRYWKSGDKNVVCRTVEGYNGTRLEMKHTKTNSRVFPGESRSAVEGP